MQNEDKMFTMLEGLISIVTRMQGDVTRMQGDITRMQGDVTQTQGDVTRIQGDITDLKQSQVEINRRLDKLDEEVLHNRVLIEDTLRQTTVIAEGHVNLNAKLDRIPGCYATKGDLAIVEVVVKQHSREIEKLKMAQ